MQEKIDAYFMNQALQEAEKAFERDEVPVGAIIVFKEKRIVAKAHNLVECLRDPTAHAEMQAITAACDFVNNKFLTDCAIYVTLEPCPMCAGAIFLSRPNRLIFAASDSKRGYTLHAPEVLHPSTQVTKGVMAERSSILMSTFFEGKR